MKLFNLINIPEELLSQVGGKARGLNQLAKFGFNVPKGFVIFDYDDNEFEKVFNTYQEMGLEDVAVRSSATNEDGDAYSNAGQYQTVLNVNGKDALKAAIKECLESLGNERSKAYSQTFLKDGTENKMTVVVQQMIHPTRAGVAFSVNPVTQKGILIEAVEGVGERLVSGEASAEQYEVIDDVINMPKDSLLTYEQVSLLADGVKKAQKEFNCHIDIEYAFGRHGNLYYLQARPVTTVDDGVTINEFDYKPDVSTWTITTANVREMMPTAVTPLTLSVSVYSSDWGYRKMMEVIHAVKNMDDLPPYSCIMTYYNSLFFPMTTAYLSHYNIAGMAKDTCDISICGRSLTEFPDKNDNPKPQLIRIKNLFKYFLPVIMSYKPIITGVDEETKKLNFNYDDSLEGLYKQTCDNMQYLNMLFYYHYRASYFSGTASTLTTGKVKKYIGDEMKAQSVLSGALTQIDGIESAKVIEMMQDLAGKIIKDNPKAKEYDVKKLAKYLSNSTGEVKDTLDNFMNVNGHRGIRESELRMKAWSDDIEMFAESLIAVIATYDLDKAKVGKPWTAYRDELLSYVPEKKREAISNQIDKGRQGAWVREYTKSKSMLGISKFRKAYRLIAQKLNQKDFLPEEDLIYFLTHDEIGQLINGDKSLIKKAMKRRRLYPIQCAMKFEEVFYGAPVPVEEEVSYEDKEVYQGIPASPGVVTGKVRIVNTVDDANKLKRGEIMVAKVTDVGWTPYYCLASALVTEIGSCLSHGVVVAREYGLPTVVNARGVLSTLKTGDEITVDGGKGTIVVLNRK